jgi:hypothetical protein
MQLDATVDIAIWSTIEIGVSVIAANMATLRPLVLHMAKGSQAWPSRGMAGAGHVMIELPEIRNTEPHAQRTESLRGDHLPLGRADTEYEAGSTCSLTRSVRRHES